MPELSQFRGVALFRSHWPFCHQVGTLPADDESADGEVANARLVSAAITTAMPMRETFTGHTLHEPLANGEEAEILSPDGLDAKFRLRQIE